VKSQGDVGKLITVLQHIFFHHIRQAPSNENTYTFLGESATGAFQKTKMLKKALSDPNKAPETGSERRIRRFVLFTSGRCPLIHAQYY
jgi:hypothetical protein